MKLGYDSRLLLIINNILHLGLFANIFETKPTLKDLQIIKNHRVYKVEERPKLIQSILTQ